MKTCVIWGDLSSEKTSENYPKVVCCEECFAEMEPDSRESGIVRYEDGTRGSFSECHFCGKTEDDENKELGQ